MSKKKRIRNLERRTAYLADMLEIVVEQQSSYLTEFEELEQEVAYLEAMVRHYIALFERDKPTTTPTIVPNQPWPLPIPPGGLNIPYPSPFGTTTATPLPVPSIKVTGDVSSLDPDPVLRARQLQRMALAHEPVLSDAWLSLDDEKAWSGL